jgi:dihydrodipicolinate synthase/N-acetylneuraminate lyase
MVKELKGLFPILATPCDERGGLDLESLRDEVEYCLENGVHGFFLGNCSELYAFSRADRNRIIEAVVDASNGKVPVVAGCFASNTGDAVELSRDAEARGVDAIFTYGPYVLGGGPTPSVDIVEHYRRVDAAVDIPIVGYNTPQGMPGVMTPERLFEILDACPGIEYMKTGETTVQGFLRTIMSGIGDRVKLIAGKSQMNFRFIEAYPEAVGMSACIASVLPAEHVEMWCHFQRGDVDAARVTWIRKILPFVELASIGGARNIRKEALHQMGVIRDPSPTRPYSTAGCDDFHRKELNAVLKLLGKI